MCARVLGALACLCMLAAGASAQMRAGASVRPDRVYAGSPTTYEVIVEGVLDADEVTPQFPAGVNARYLFRRSQPAPVVIINGRQVESGVDRVAYQWELLVDVAGEYHIPPAEVRVGSETVRTQPVVLTVIEPSEPDDFAFVVEPSKTVAYVGEPIRIRGRYIFGRVPSTLFFRGWLDDTAAHLYPTPAPRGTERRAAIPFIGGEVEGTLTRAVLGGVERDAVDVERIIVPLVPGPLEIGPWSMTFRLPTPGDSRRSEQCIVRSKPTIIEVLPLPTQGRPANFSGLVGKAAVRSLASPTAVNVGDPITLEITIAADHPLQRIKPPDLTRQAGLLESFKVESTGWQESGSPVGGRTFTITLRARNADVDSIPAIELPYFDPETGRYAVALSRPIPLEVRPTREVTLADAIVAPADAAGPVEYRPGLENARPSLLANVHGPSLLVNDSTEVTSHVSRPLLGAILVLPVASCVAAAIIAFVRRPDVRAWRRRSGAAFRARRRLARAGSDPALISRALRFYIGDRLDHSGEALTDADCRRLLAPADGSAAEELASILQACERARFSPMGTTEDLVAEARRVLGRVEHALRGGRA